MMPRQGGHVPWGALLLCLLISTAAATLDSCPEQYDCIKWSITDVQEKKACTGAATCEYRVCLTTDYRGTCSKRITDKILNGCGNVWGCATPGTSKGWNASLPHNKTLCQSGLGGTDLLFVLQDSASCNQEATYYPFTDTSIRVSCSAEGAQDVCNRHDGECVWRVSLPECPSPSYRPDSPARSPSPSRSPSRSPTSKSPSPSPTSRSPSMSPGVGEAMRPSASPSPSPKASPRPLCQDEPGWTDLDGDTCDDYQRNQWCKNYKATGAGWDANWGKLSAFEKDGLDATDACCFCGGGRYDDPCQVGPWSAWSVCSTACGGGQMNRTRTVGSTDPRCATLDSAPCNQTACSCKDLPAWRDRLGNNCSKYVQDQWCNSSQGYGPGWQAAWGTFANRAVNGIDATKACCGCGSHKCVADVMLVVDRSGSIGLYYWGVVAKYLADRVNGVNFTDGSGNRLGIVVFSTRSNVVCPITYDKAALLRCIDGIVYSGGFTFMADAITMAGDHLNAYSSPGRTRVIEVITDGESTNAKPLTQRAAQAQKDTGVIMIAIGVGTGANDEELQGIASYPKEDHWANLGSFTALNSLAKIISQACIPEIRNGSTTVWERDPSPSEMPSKSPSPSVSASSSPRPSASASPVLASKSPSPSPWPSASPSPELQPSPSPAFCDRLEFNAEYEMLYASVDRPRCSLNEVLRILPAHCKRASKECQLIYCEETLPEGVMARVADCS